VGGAGAVQAFLPVASSPQARAIEELFNTTFVVCGIIFAVVAGLVGYALLKFRGKDGDAPPKQIEGHTRLELAWTIVPLLIVAWIFLLTTRAMNAAYPPANRAPDLTVTAH